MWCYIGWVQDWSLLSLANLLQSNKGILCDRWFPQICSGSELESRLTDEYPCGASRTVHNEVQDERWVQSPEQLGYHQDSHIAPRMPTLLHVLQLVCGHPCACNSEWNLDSHALLCISLAYLQDYISKFQILCTLMYNAVQMSQCYGKVPPCAGHVTAATGCTAD